MFDPKIVEAISAATCDAFHNGECVTSAALTALCAHLRITPEALNALAKGEAVVVPKIETEAMHLAAFDRDMGADESLYPSIYRAMLAASPYAPQEKGGGDA